MKFHIRDILWLTILVAVAVAWWLDHRVTARRLEELNNQVQTEREAERNRTAQLEAMLKAERIERREALYHAKLREAVREFEKQGRSAR